jgi:hypothetical protein
MAVRCNHPYRCRILATDCANGFFRYALGQRLHNHGECIMGEQGKKDRSTREKKKEPQMTLKEKRQAKKDKAKVKKSYE